MKQIFIAWFFAAMAFAQDTPPSTDSQKETQRVELLTQIFSQLDTPTFKQAIEKSRKAGIPEQVLLEARFLHWIDQDDSSALAKLAPELLAFRDRFNLELSEVFGVKEDWLSVIEYTQALSALEKGDNDSFKKHIKEAFWLNPRHAQIYAPHIERLRLLQAMAKTTISPELKIQPQQGGQELTFASLVNEKKALVLHFWSPMSQEVAINMPDFVLTSNACQANGIAVASILIGKTPEVLKDAETVRKKHQENAKCTWLSDTEGHSLTSMLRITDIPTMVIISPKGKILFNGHPSESDFWNKIQQIAPNFKRPNNSKHSHSHE